MTTATQKAATLVEALPYLQRFRGKSFLIKMGGSVMEDEELVSALMRDIVFLELAGINPIVVHGGGKRPGMPGHVLGRDFPSDHRSNVGSVHRRAP